MASLGEGTKLKKKKASVFTAIADVANVTPPGAERNEVEVERLDPPDGYADFLPGLKRAGEATMTLNFDPDNESHTELLDDFESGATHTWRIVLPSGKALEFDAFVKGLSPQEITAEGVIQQQATLKVRGKLEWVTDGGGGGGT